MRVLRRIAKKILIKTGFYDKYCDYMYERSLKQRIIKDYDGGSASFWTSHMVTDNEFSSAEGSLEYFHWRNNQYPGYIDLMPVSGQNGKVVLDYGCGPGNDLVGFTVFSSPAKLIGVDVSTTALNASKHRLSLHCNIAEKNIYLHLIDESDNKIPVEDNTVDYVHSSGVLMSVANINFALKEIHRVLKVGGKMAAMVYNHDSIWSNLYVPWFLQTHLKIDTNLTFEEAFRRSTDNSIRNEAAPVSCCYRPDEFIKLVESVGFKGEFKGAAISGFEVNLTRKYLDKAVSDKRLGEKYRIFLKSLEIDEKGIPYYKENVAGIDACYLFVKS